MLTRWHGPGPIRMGESETYLRHEATDSKIKETSTPQVQL
jgi:hypothetical protein